MEIYFSFLASVGNCKLPEVRTVRPWWVSGALAQRSGQELVKLFSLNRTGCTGFAVLSFGQLCMREARLAHA